nr:PP2C family protein-serine/threonine phosphatase [Thiothrix subterranea]
MVDTRQEQLYFVQAGHPQPFLYSPVSDEWEQLDCTGFPIGLLPDMEYDTIRLPFPSGSRLILYSDGLLELHEANGAMMTELALKNYLQPLRQQPAQQLIQQLAITLGLDNDAKEKPDDISLLIIDFFNGTNAHQHIQ